MNLIKLKNKTKQRHTIWRQICMQYLLQHILCCLANFTIIGKLLLDVFITMDSCHLEIP